MSTINTDNSDSFVEEVLGDVNKLENWKKYLSSIKSKRAESNGTISQEVCITDAINLSVSPASVRASFPYPSLPPYRILSASDILDEIINVPCVAITGLFSYLWGVCVASCAMSLTGSRASTTTEGGRRYIFENLKMIFIPQKTLIIPAVAVSFGWFFIKRFFIKPKRFPTVCSSVSAFADVSNCNFEGVCCVSTKVVSIVNSHAGTHADQPSHFMASTTDNANNNANNNNNTSIISSNYKDFYPEEHYTGDAMVLDVSDIILEQVKGNAQERILSGMALGITVDVLKVAEERYKVDFTNAWRILFITNSYDDDEAEEIRQSRWQSKFSFLTPAAVRYLCSKAKNLLLVGLDTPSVDHPSCSVLHRGSHGHLFANNVAIIENLSFALLLPSMSEYINGESVTNSGEGDGDMWGTDRKGSGAFMDPFGVAGGHMVKHRHVAMGVILTVFNPMQEFVDSRGCQVLFFPSAFM